MRFLSSRMARQRVGFVGLLVGLLLLVAWLTWSDHAARSLSQPQWVTGYQAQKINHIRILRKGRPILAFERRNGSWYLEFPIQARANGALVQSLLALPAIQGIRSYAIQKNDLAQYGLDPPKVRIDYGQFRLAWGGVNPLNGWRYMAYRHRLFLVPTGLSDLPEGPFLNWVSLRLLPSRGRIRKIAQVKFPVSGHARPESWVSYNMKGLLGVWQRAIALRLQFSPALKSRPLGEVRVELTDRSSILFQVMAMRPRLKLRDPRRGIEYDFTPGESRQLLNFSVH